MWGTDLTSVMTGEGQATVFIAVDHGSAECVCIHASQRTDRFEALEPVRQAVRERFGGFAKIAAPGLKLRHDHGSQYVSHDFQAEIRFLGIQSSPAFARKPEGNGCAERFVRVLKENLPWGPSFRHRRGAALGAARVSAKLQPELDRRAAWLPDPGPGSGRPSRPGAQSCVGHQPRLESVDRYRDDAAWCELRRDFRHFRADRIIACLPSTACSKARVNCCGRSGEHGTSCFRPFEAIENSHLDERMGSAAVLSCQAEVAVCHGVPVPNTVLRMASIPSSCRRCNAAGAARPLVPWTQPQSASTMAPKSVALREAPPTNAPSTSGMAKICAAFAGLTEPP